MRLSNFHFTRGLLLAIFLTSGARPFAAPAEVTKPTVDMAIYGHVVQVGWVVKDVDRVVDYWEKLGLKNVQRASVREFPGVTYRGKKTSLSLKMAFADIGGVEIEWIQPIKGASVYDEFLKKHGDGVHHLAYAVKSPPQLEEQIGYFKSRGVGVVQRGSWEGKKGQGLFAYLDTAPQGGGLTIELMFSPDAPRPGRGASIPANDYPFNEIVQYALVVRDVKKVGAFYERLGFGGMPVDHNVSVDRVYRGRPGKFEMFLGWGRFADVTFEWIQSLVGPSVYDEYLKAHGEGLHHLAFNVTDMDEAIKLLAVRGAPVSQSGGWKEPGNEGRFAYLDTEPYGGVTIELLWNKPASP
jgi:catechol 2,3-dioxygenase-like lactoylglutathione lyase family enzyme